MKRNLDKFFTAEDFNTHNIINVITGNITLSREDACRLANARFREIVAGRRIYGKHMSNRNYDYWHVHNLPDDTHTAILICEEKI